MATIYEVSKLAGVSLATVSRVMNDSGRVSDKTRDKELEAMCKLDYRPNTVSWYRRCTVRSSVRCSRESKRS